MLLDEGVEVAIAALDLRRDLVETVVDGACFRESGPKFLNKRALGIETGLLPQVPERTAPVPATSDIRLVLAGEDLENRGLAGAVRANEPRPLAVAENERDVLENGERPEGARDGFGEEHGVFRIAQGALEWA